VRKREGGWGIGGENLGGDCGHFVPSAAAEEAAVAFYEGATRLHKVEGDAIGGQLECDGHWLRRGSTTHPTQGRSGRDSEGLCGGIILQARKVWPRYAVSLYEIASE